MKLFLALSCAALLFAAPVFALSPAQQAPAAVIPSIAPAAPAFEIKPVKLPGLETVLAFNDCPPDTCPRLCCPVLFLGPCCTPPPPPAPKPPAGSVARKKEDAHGR